MTESPSTLLIPGPVSVSQTVRQALLGPDMCPREQAFKDLINRVTRRLVDVVHGGDDYVAVIFEGSGTAALEACLSSVVSDDAALCVLSNGGYGQRIAEIARIHRLRTVKYTVPWGTCFDLTDIRSLLLRSSVPISHLAFVHHETTTGMLNPVADCAEIARQIGAEVIVDAMSSYGGIPINVGELGIDYLISSASKCLQGIAGLSFVIGRRDSIRNCAELCPKSLYLDLWAQYSFLAEESAFRFTAPVQVFYALDQALNEWFAETETGRWRRYQENHGELVDGLERLGFRIPIPPECRSGLAISVWEPTHPSFSFRTMHGYLSGEGFTIYPDRGGAEGIFRLANIGQIDRHDIRRFLGALERYLIDAGLVGHLYDRVAR